MVRTEVLASPFEVSTFNLQLSIACLALQLLGAQSPGTGTYPKQCIATLTEVLTTIILAYRPSRPNLFTPKELPQYLPWSHLKVKTSLRFKRVSPVVEIVNL